MSNIAVDTSMTKLHTRTCLHISKYCYKVKG